MIVNYGMEKANYGWYRRSRVFYTFFQIGKFSRHGTPLCAEDAVENIDLINPLHFFPHRAVEHYSLSLAIFNMLFISLFCYIFFLLFPHWMETAADSHEPMLVHNLYLHVLCIVVLLLAELGAKKHGPNMKLMIRGASKMRIQLLWKWSAVRIILNIS